MTTLVAAIAHGSSDPAAVSHTLAFARKYVGAACAELDHQLHAFTLGDRLPKVDFSSVQRALLVPLVMAEGSTHNRICACWSDWISNEVEKHVALAPFSKTEGFDDALGDFARCHAATQSETRELHLVAHGNRNATALPEWVARAKRAVAAAVPNTTVNASLLDGHPNVRDTGINISPARTANAIGIPLFVGSGPHVSRDLRSYFGKQLTDCFGTSDQMGAILKDAARKLLKALD